MKKPKKPKWRRKGESLSHFEARQRRYVDRVIAWMRERDKEKARKK